MYVHSLLATVCMSYVCSYPLCAHIAVYAMYIHSYIAMRRMCIASYVYTLELFLYTLMFVELENYCTSSYVASCICMYVCSQLNSINIYSVVYDFKCTTYAIFVL